MKKLLIAANSDATLEKINTMVTSIQPDAVINTVTESKKGQSIVDEDLFDLVIINTPLSGSSGLSFAEYAAETAMNAVLLITGDSFDDKAAARFADIGVITVKRPVDKNVFKLVLEHALILGRRTRLLKEQNIQIRESLEEIRLVNRAKAALMSSLNMKESQAHRYIEKQAMDLRTSKRIIAQNILKTYYNK